MKPRISVISVNYNGFALTAAMIDSLRRHVTTPLEIVVVDNGSQRDEATELQERYPEIIAIRSPENLGFAGGNNLGIRAASGDRLLLLNNDTEVGDDTRITSRRHSTPILRSGPSAPKSASGRPRRRSSSQATHP